MRTPNEIKEALTCNRNNCKGCAYNIERRGCSKLIMTDALNYIERLEDDVRACKTKISHTSVVRESWKRFYNNAFHMGVKVKRNNYEWSEEQQTFIRKQVGR